MRVSREELERRLVRFADACRRGGLKVTHQRLEIFRELARTDEHPDAETIYKRVRARLPTVSLDTVYRTLRLAMDLGLASAVLTDGTRVRHDANTRPHHHFVCTRCRLVRDFYVEDLEGFHIPKEVKSWGRVSSVHLELRGVCARCRSRRK